MSWTRTTGRLLALIAVIALAITAWGCETKPSPSTGSEDPASAEAPAASQPAPEEPQYTSWQLYINDDDSFTKGGITYDIALNLKATNPSSKPAGTYTGEATAKTSSTGMTGGYPLDASAIASSTMLKFKLHDLREGGGPTDLAADPADLLGSGKIVMKASGSGTIGAAGGSFGNTSGQEILVSVKGETATLKVKIDGHTYTFKGTLTGKE